MQISLQTRMPILPNAPGREPHGLPVGRPIRRAPEARAFDKGLQQHDPMRILTLVQGVPGIAGAGD